SSLIIAQQDDRLMTTPGENGHGEQQAHLQIPQRACTVLPMDHGALLPAFVVVGLASGIWVCLFTGGGTATSPPKYEQLPGSLMALR
ncbi:MAG TPA: hypothetical protein VFV38_06190, partial [Ktedonobacteraceae bacterium]|nr:hypothetical protein [Ktedonobacteraceae bacterium]